MTPVILAAAVPHCGASTCCEALLPWSQCGRGSRRGHLRNAPAGGGTCSNSCSKSCLLLLRLLLLLLMLLLLQLLLHIPASSITSHWQCAALSAEFEHMSST